MLRRSFAFLLLAVATTRLVAQEPAESNALEKEPYGSFVPAPKFAKAFREITRVQLSGAGEYGVQAKPKAYYGTIETKGGATFVVAERQITGRKITFATEAVRGVSYKFSGTLARTDFHDGGVPMNEVMLSGRMTKLKNGKEVAVGDVAFFFEAGG